MAKADNPVATKKDIEMLMGEIGKLYDANERWKDDILVGVDGKILASEKRTKEHFDVVAENLHYDFLGAHKDKIENHEDRIVRLEQRAGLARIA